jgi:hypothetical protein
MNGTASTRAKGEVPPSGRGGTRAWDDPRGSPARTLPGTYRKDKEAVMPAEYEFIDEWDVDAPPGAVFDALADARTYPEWWRPVYLEVDADGPPAVGCASRRRLKGGLPYTLAQTSTVTACDAPHSFEVEAVGGLTGHGHWTLTQRPAGNVHVR